MKQSEDFRFNGFRRATVKHFIPHLLALCRTARRAVLIAKHRPGVGITGRLRADGHMLLHHRNGEIWPQHLFAAQRI